MQRLKVFLSANAPILHKLVSHCFSSLLTFLVMESRWKQAYLELQKVRMSQDLKSKKRPALFYINSGKLEKTQTPTLDHTLLPLLRHLTYLWLCPSLWCSSLLYLSLLLWLSFHEALQSCFTNLPALDSIPYYSVLCSTFLRRRQSALTSL